MYRSCWSRSFTSPSQNVLEQIYKMFHVKTDRVPTNTEQSQANQERIEQEKLEETILVGY